MTIERDNGIDPNNQDNTNDSTDDPIEQVKWEKILWRKQPFPDNYVPPSFLSELSTLEHRPRPKLLNLIFAALPITQHLSVIAIFLAVFWRLLEGHLGSGDVIWACVGLGILGYLIRKYGWDKSLSRPESPTSTLVPAPTPLRPLLLPPLLLSLLSPILGTLTSATTSDTIWPLAGGLFFVHLLLADFTTGRNARLRRKEKEKRRARRASIGAANSNVLEEIEEKSLTSSLSLTSALSASIVLASRLPSTSHVFSLVLLAVGLFAGWPSIAKDVREAGKPFSALLTSSMMVLAISLFPQTTSNPDAMFPLSLPIWAFLIVILLVNILGPWLLWYGWRWKTRRGGGWEVARVRIRKGKKGQG